MKPSSVLKLAVSAVMLSWALVACGAPRAAPLEGDIASTLERGVREGDSRFDHRAWNELLGKYAVDGGRRFDYAGLLSDESAFEAYLERLANADIGALPASEIQALFTNAYNAYTVRTILDHVDAGGNYDIESITDIADVFTREVHPVGGFVLSLDNIEHNILRPTFRDPRFHFAVNCASISCPPLPTEAFTGERLDEQLETATRAVLRNPDYVRADGAVLRVTKIMDWYGGDFVNPDYAGSEDTLAQFIRRYATDDVRALIDREGADLRIAFDDYDWSLNRSE